MKRAANIRIREGGMARLREIAASFGAVSKSGIQAGEASISELLDRVVTGELVIKERKMTMDCLTCGNQYGTQAAPMHYLFREEAGRNDIEGFCSVQCALDYAQAHQEETASVPRCAVCGEIIVNAPWYASLSDQGPRHHECTEGAD